jgi:hypothetical protein
MSKKYKLKKTGNLAIDMVCECVAHYKKMGKKVKYINLSTFLWLQFKDGIRKLEPTIEKVDDEGIMFGNTIIRKGHRFQVENLEVEFYHQIITAQA